MRTQTITIILKLKEDQKPYDTSVACQCNGTPDECKGDAHKPYNELLHFFNDINYNVTSIDTKEE